jgi:hypothetical protein
MPGDVEPGVKKLCTLASLQICVLTDYKLSYICPCAMKKYGKVEV